MEWMTLMVQVDENYTEDEVIINSYEMRIPDRPNSNKLGQWIYQYMLPDGVTKASVEEDFENNSDLLMNIIDEHSLPGDNKDNVEFVVLEEDNNLFLEISYTCDKRAGNVFDMEFGEDDEDDNNEFDMYPEESEDN